jgi:hypothetical protein
MIPGYTDAQRHGLNRQAPCALLDRSRTDGWQD